jgi:hypothetical protein
MAYRAVFEKGGLGGGVTKNVWQVTGVTSEEKVGGNLKGALIASNVNNLIALETTYIAPLS